MLACMKSTAQITFEGGPLDGTVGAKGKRGKWPAGLNAQGETIPTAAVDRLIRTESTGFYANSGPIPTTDGTVHRLYRWWPAKHEARDE